LIQGAAKPNSIKASGLTFPDAESSYSNLAMLMEQEKFSDDMDPQLLSGRTLSRLVDEIFSPFRNFSPTPSGGKKNLPSDRDLNFH
jgi:hypothetical protein